MPGFLAVVSDADVHDSIEDRARSLCVEPWMTATCEEVVPGAVTIGRISNGIFDAGLPPMARDGDRVAVVDGYVVAPDDLWEEAGLDRRTAERPEDLVLALAARGRATGWAGRLDGAFAILLWDGGARTLTVITDRYGFRPHYVAWDGRNLVVGPSVRFVLGFPWVSADLHPGSVVEQFAFQSVLEDRTCFQDVEVLPPHAATTVTVEPRRRRTKRTWSFDRVPFREDIRFEDAVEESLALYRRALRRHTAGNHRYGVLLSGGMDSRILLAGMTADRRPLPTFTFGLADSRDISGARALSRLAGVKNHAFPFSSGDWVREVAQRHVELTDGMHGLFHAHGLHMARDVRQHMDVNLCGLGGGIAIGGHKLFRSLQQGDPDWTAAIDVTYAHGRKVNGIGFVDDRDLTALFTEGFSRDARSPRDALEKSLEPLRGCRVTQIPQFASLLHRERKHLVYMLVFARPYYEDALPYFDHDLIDFGLSLPIGLRWRGRLQDAVLERLAPRLATVPKTKTDRPPTHRFGPRLRWKAGRTLAGITRTLSGGRLSPARCKYDVTYDAWTRNELFDWARSVLLHERTLARGVFDPAFVRRVFEPPIPDGRAWTWQIGMMLSFELMLRHLVDRSTG